MAISMRKYNFEYYFRRDFEYKILSMTYKSAELLSDEMKATGFEISYHPGHRPTHTFGGQQFTFEEMETKGISKMLNEYNCRHLMFPVIVGVTPSKYSAAELAWLAELETKKYEYDDSDKKYTLYELSQILRKYERMIDKYERDITYYEAMGTRGKNGLAKAKDMLGKQEERIKQLTEMIDKIVAEHLAMMPKMEPDIYAIPKTDKTRLSDEQQTSNAEYIFKYLSNQGWSKEAIYGLLGNINQESWFNPGVWEMQDDPFWGYGIVQWTPYPRNSEVPNPFLDWAGLTVATANEMATQNPKQLIDLQLEFLLWSSQPGRGVWLSAMGISVYNSPYAMTFAEFIISNNNPGELAKVFNGHYERSSDAQSGTHANRVEHANDWYEYFCNW